MNQDSKSRRVAAPLPGLAVLLMGALYVRWHWIPAHLERWEISDAPQIIADSLGAIVFVVTGFVIVIMGLYKGASFVHFFGRSKWPWISEWASKSPRLLPDLHRPYPLIVLPVFFTHLIYLGIVQSRERFLFDELLTFVYYSASAIAETGIFVSVILVLGAIRMKPVAALIAFVLISLRMADAMMYSFSHDQLELYHFTLLSDYALKSFLSPQTIALAAWVLLAAGAIGFALYRCERRSIGPASKRWVVFTLFFVLLGPQNLCFAFRHMFTIDSFERDTHRSKFIRFREATQDSVENLYEEWVERSSVAQVHSETSVEPFKEVCAEWSLPLGERSYESIQEKPIKRVLLVVVESLSSVLLSAFNRELQNDNSSHFFSRPDVRSGTFTNHRPSILYTEKGLTMMLSSHPNLYVTYETRFRGSLVHILNKNSFQTIMIRTDSRFYADGMKLFSQAGFDRIISREDFLENEQSAKYANDWWGVCDRVAYDEAVNQLAKRLDQKTFIMILGTDTHLPYGRPDYGDLDYPDYPGEPGVVDSGQPHMLRAMFRADYDLNRLIRRLDEEGLWNDETLVLVTGDHAAPLSATWSKVPGYPSDTLHPVPLVILTPNGLPNTAQLDKRCCQMDLAPTLLHLLGLPIPVGYWGSSLLDDSSPHNFIGTSKGSLRLAVGPSTNENTLPINSSTWNSKRTLADLFWTLVTDGLPSSSNENAGELRRSK